MNEIITINTAELKNRKMATQLNTINKAIATGEKSKWTIAEAIKKIIDGELYIDDFENEQALADVLGMSRPQLNKLKRAVDYKEVLGEEWGVSQILELLPIPLEELESVVADYQISSSDNCRTIREAVQCYKEDVKGAKENKEDNADIDEDSAEETAEGKTEVEKDHTTPDTLERITNALNGMNANDLEELAEYMEVMGWL